MNKPNNNEKRLTLDIMEQMIEEAFTRNGLKLVVSNDKVGQSSVTFYPKQKKEQESK